MKVHALPIITLILASSSVQAQNGSKQMMNPIPYANPNTMMAPANGMAPMMAAPMGYMNPNTMMNPATMINPMAIMLAPMLPVVMGMMNLATMMNQMAMMAVPPQAPATNHSVPAYGMPATPAQGAYMPFFPAAPAPQQVTSSQAPVPAMFDPSAWIKMFPNSVPPTTAASPALASAAQPGPAAPAPAHKQMKKTRHHHHAKKESSDKPAEAR
ncbi:MAG: hypothetical protein WBX11_09475 [Thiobacillaceae bacterium]